MQRNFQYNLIRKDYLGGRPLSQKIVMYFEPEKDQGFQVNTKAPATNE